MLDVQELDQACIFSIPHVKRLVGDQPFSGCPWDPNNESRPAAVCICKRENIDVPERVARVSDDPGLYVSLTWWWRAILTELPILAWHVNMCRHIKNLLS